MIRVYAKEYMNICKFLMKNGNTNAKSNRIRVEKALLEELLNKNAYEEVQTKLKTWRKLEWLDADPEHLTKRVYIKNPGGEGVYQRMYVLKKDIYKILCEIEEKST